MSHNFSYSPYAIGSGVLAPGPIKIEGKGGKQATAVSGIGSCILEEEASTRYFERLRARPGKL
jgi:hypothetical protein